MNSITYARHSPHTGEASTTMQVVAAYQSVFGDPPWNEWMRCSVCQSVWGSKDRAQLGRMNFRHCDTPLEEYWPAARVSDDFDHEIGPDASCWLALEDKQVIGFCWGYPVATDVLEKKLAVPLVGPIFERFNVSVVAYQDELGILSAFRGQKLAKELFLRRHRDFIEKGLCVGIVRTRRLPEPSVTYLWFTEKLGYEVVGEYPDGRVVLARDLHGLEDLLQNA